MPKMIKYIIEECKDDQVQNNNIINELSYRDSDGFGLFRDVVITDDPAETLVGKIVTLPDLGDPAYKEYHWIEADGITTCLDTSFVQIYTARNQPEDGTSRYRVVKLRKL